MKKIFYFCVVFLLSFNLFGGEIVVAENPGVGPKPDEDRPSVCLVLAGGGAKGFAHLPILELIEKMDIPVDMVIGTSIGAIVGGLYSAGYTPYEIMEEFDKVDWTPLFSDFTTSPYENVLGEHSVYSNPIGINLSDKMSLKMGSSISYGQNIYSLFKQLTLKYPSDMDFNEFPIPFRAMVADIVTGQGVVMYEGDLSEAIRASMSLPSVFEPVEIDGHYYMDGGIRNNLAVSVAKRMGYDIIIAIDISAKLNEDVSSYSSNPAVAIMNVVTMANFERNQNEGKNADLLIVPDMKDFGLLDFKKSSLIYEEGQISAVEYKDALENVRKVIYPDDYDENGNRISSYKELRTRGVYRKKPNYIPTKLKINNAVPQDIKYIENSFKKINDEELQPKTFNNFMQDVYLTGNYTSVKTHVYDEGEETILELILTPKDLKSAKILLGTELKQTISTESTCNFTTSLDFQYRGLTGVGSVLAFDGKFVNDFSGEFYYFQPFNPYLYLELTSSYLKKAYHASEKIKKTVIDEENPENYLGGMEFTSYNYNIFLNKLLLGIRTTNGNLIKAGIFYDYGSSDSLTLYEDPFFSILEAEYNIKWFDPKTHRLKGSCFGGSINYSLNKMDRFAFAHKGFYLDTTTKLIVPYIKKEVSSDLCVVSSLELKGAIPLNKKMSINLNLFGGTDFTHLFDEENPQNLITNYPLLPFEGFSSYDRVYFPQISSEIMHGSNKACATVALQIEPFDDITILGGKLLFRIEGSIGNVVVDWKSFFGHELTEDEKGYTDIYNLDYHLLWNASVGMGAIVRQSFTVLLRAGVCSNIRYSIAPFFSLDIGAYKF